MMAHFDRHSRIFIVRLWVEERETILLLRGMVRNVESGETRYFRQWQDLVAFVDKERRRATKEELEKKGPEQPGPEQPGPEKEQGSAQE